MFISPKKDFDRLNKYSLQEGDILISVVGTPGSSAIVNKTIIPAIFSCKSTVFRTTTLNTLYLVAYLNCKYGKKLLERKIRGALQTGLNIDDLKLLPIFIPDKKSQNSISDLVDCSEKELNNSINFYTQAEDLLLDQLGLKSFKFEDQLSFTTNLSKVKFINRIDAEYFQPKYYNALDKVYDLRTTSEVAEWTPRR